MGENTESLSEAIADPNERVEIEVDAPARTWHLVVGSVEFWALVGGISAMITAVTAVAAVFIGVSQLNDAKALQVMNSTYVSWNNLNQATLANPEFACPNTPAKFQKLMTSVDPKSPTGGTYADRYSAYGYQLITTDEQILQMAPHDQRWRFLIMEQMRCQAPAVRYLMTQGTYDQRYSCRLRQIIAEALNTAQPNCAGD
jgi:hypothetical protein